MTTLTGDLLLRFMDATAAMRHKGPPVQDWLRHRVIERSGNRCWHCSKEASAVVHLISPALGGQKSERNFMAVCPACRVLFLDQDPLALSWQTGKPLAEGQRLQREDALAGAAQHAVPTTAQRSVATCTAWLSANRWLHPRVPVAVLYGHEETWLAPVAATPGMAWATLAVATREAGAVPVKMLPSVLLLPSAQWEALAWTLIERGALLRRVHVEGVAERVESLGSEQGKPYGPGPWDQLFHGVRAAARGREAKPRSGFGNRVAVTEWAARPRESI